MSDRDIYEQQAIDAIREQLAIGMAAVRASEHVQGAAAITFEELLARAISDIEDDESDIRLGRLNELTRIKEAVSSAIERAKELPASMFELAESSSVSNSRVEE